MRAWMQIGSPIPKAKAHSAVMLLLARYPALVLSTRTGNAPAISPSR
jgi:hypothetical protein